MDCIYSLWLIHNDVETSHPCLCICLIVVSLAYDQAASGEDRVPLPGQSSSRHPQVHAGFSQRAAQTETLQHGSPHRQNAAAHDVQTRRPRGTALPAYKCAASFCLETIGWRVNEFGFFVLVFWQIIDHLSLIENSSESEVEAHLRRAMKHSVAAPTPTVHLNSNGKKWNSWSQLRHLNVMFFFLSPFQSQNTQNMAKMKVQASAGWSVAPLPNFACTFRTNAINGSE